MGVRLDDKVAIVTGASAGIGRAVSIDFARRGAKVIGTGRRGEIDTGKVIEEFGGVFTYVQADVSRWEDCRRTVDTALAEHGQIDILINNAANAIPLKRIEEVTPEDWQAVRGPTLDGAFFMTSLTLPAMQARSEGIILFTTSGVAKQALARWGCYGTAKAAIIGLANTVAVENSGNGIRANAVVMGIVATEMADKTFLDMGRQVHGPDWSPAPPVPDADPGPMGAIIMQPDEVAKSLAALCVDEARELTGGVIALDRGILAGKLTSMSVELGAASMG